VNDLMNVREALGEPESPSREARAAARAALLRHAAAARMPTQLHTRRPVARRARRTGWLGLTAAAAAAVIAVIAVVATTTPSTTARGDHRNNAQEGAVTPLSARQILLDAAISAAAAPTQTGTYWYLKEIAGPGPVSKATTQSWYTSDGSVYTLIPHDNGVFLASKDAGFSVGASSLTYQQIQHLPANPAALTAWITRSFSHPQVPSDPSGAPQAVYSPPPSDEIPGAVAVSLGELLSEIPAPPAVRAAAFRALAALPDVTELSRAGGEAVLRITFPAPPANKYPSGKVPAGADEMRLVIDTSTLALRAWSDDEGTTTILAARWTNALPPVIPASKLAHGNG
jgi:hypothetical protein